MFDFYQSENYSKVRTESFSFMKEKKVCKCDCSTHIVMVSEILHVQGVLEDKCM